MKHDGMKEKYVKMGGYEWWLSVCPYNKNHVTETEKSSPQEEHIFYVFLSTPNIDVFKENSSDVLTDFLDIFLTKENCKIDVKEC